MRAHPHPPAPPSSPTPPTVPCRTAAPMPEDQAALLRASSDGREHRVRRGDEGPLEALCAPAHAASPACAWPIRPHRPRALMLSARARPGSLHPSAPGALSSIWLRDPFLRPVRSFRLASCSAAGLPSRAGMPSRARTMGSTTSTLMRANATCAAALAPPATTFLLCRIRSACPCRYFSASSSTSAPRPRCTALVATLQTAAGSHRAV